jgi:hypothetical protein
MENAPSTASLNNEWPFCGNKLEPIIPFARRVLEHSPPSCY